MAEFDIRKGVGFVGRTQTVACVIVVLACSSAGFAAPFFSVNASPAGPNEWVYTVYNDSTAGEQGVSWGLHWNAEDPIADGILAGLYFNQYNGYINLPQGWLMSSGSVPGFNVSNIYFFALRPGQSVGNFELRYTPQATQDQALPRYFSLSYSSNGNIETLPTGEVPEPGVLVTLALGLSALATRKRARR
jgi:hypothetical protein